MPKLLIVVKGKLERVICDWPAHKPRSLQLAYCDKKLLQHMQHVLRSWVYMREKH